MPIKPDLLHHYKTDAYKRARDKSRRKAKGKCAFCGVKNGRMRSHTKIILCTRHMDGDPANNAARNLKQLCQACHLEAARAFNRERQLKLFGVDKR